MDWKLAVKDVGELSNWMEPIGWNQEGDKVEPHVTLLIAGDNAANNYCSAGELKEAQEVLQRIDDGTEVTFDVTAILKHEDLIIAEVDLPEDVNCASALPHLMLWRSQRATPSLAYQLLRDPQSCADSACFDPPISLRGIVTVEKKEDPSNFEGKILKVEIQPLLNKQAEPKGHATFLCEEDADTWKAPLAQSIKEDPAGPEGCKLKANVQGAGRPGHIYLRWGAAFSNMTAKEIVQILETRLGELMD